MTACEQGEQGKQPNAINNPTIEKQVTRLFEAIKANDFDSAVKEYDKSFFTNSSPEEWTDKLKAALAERGPMQSYALRRSQADTRFSGKFYILEYNSIHDGNKRLHHILTFVAPVTGGDIQLLGHKIKPWEAKEL